MERTPKLLHKLFDFYKTQYVFDFYKTDIVVFPMSNTHEQHYRVMNPPPPS